MANTTHAKAATEHIDFHRVGHQVPSVLPIQSAQKLQLNTLMFTHSDIKSRVLGPYNASIDGYKKQFIIRKTHVKNMKPANDGATTTKGAFCGAIPARRREHDL